MAIDMIEQSDFGNFSSGRLGLKSFADEDSCANFDGSENFGVRRNDNEYKNFLIFAPIVGNKKRKASIENVKREQDAKWSAKPQKTCEDLRRNLVDVQIDIETLTKQSATSKDFWIQPALETARKWQGEFKKMRNAMDCDVIEAKEKAEREKAETLDTLKKLSDTSAEQIKKDISELSGKDGQGQKIFGLDKNVVMYAGAGLGAILVFALILRK